MAGLFPGMMICKSCTAIMQVCEGLWMSPGDICHITHQLSLSQTLQRMPQTPSALMLV